MPDLTNPAIANPTGLVDIGSGIMPTIDGFMTSVQSIDQLDAIGLIVILFGMIIILTCLSGIFMEYARTRKTRKRRR